MHILALFHHLPQDLIFSVLVSHALLDDPLKIIINILHLRIFPHLVLEPSVGSYRSLDGPSSLARHHVVTTPMSIVRSYRELIKIIMSSNELIFILSLGRPNVLAEVIAKIVAKPSHWVNLVKLLVRLAEPFFMQLPRFLCIQFFLHQLDDIVF